MRYRLIVVGIIMIILPFLGFPDTWRNLFYVVLGLIIIYFAFPPQMITPPRGGIRKNTPPKV